MSGYHASAFVTALIALALFTALLGVACGEDMEVVFRGHPNGDDEQLRRIPRRSKDDGAGPVAITHRRRRMSAADLLGDKDSQQDRFHLLSPVQRRRTQSGCDERSPFSLTSSLSSDYEGCYYFSELTIGDDGDYLPVYSPSGTPDVGQTWMHLSGVELDGVVYEGVGATSSKIAT